MTSEARDIVERLAGHAGQLVDLTTIERRELSDALLEAAKEIGRLRHRVERLEVAHHKIITRVTPYPHENGADHRRNLLAAETIARQALEPRP